MLCKKKLGVDNWLDLKGLSNDDGDANADGKEQ